MQTPDPSTLRKRTRLEADPRKVAIVLPGMGYTPDMPLLYWTSSLLHDSGWTIQQVWWYDLTPPERGSEWLSWVSTVAAEAVAAERDADRVLLVGKSLGTFAIPFAADERLTGIWHTPIITDDEPDMRAALPRLPPSLLLGGTADTSWDGAVARASGQTVCEIEGADHALEIAGDPPASLAALGQVVDAVQEFIAQADS